MLIIIIFCVVALLIAPTCYVRYIIHRHSKDLDYIPGTGGELARHLIKKFGIENSKVIEDTQGDYYHPDNKTIHLQSQHFNGKSLAAITIAAHEFGHALQDFQQLPLLRLRTSLGKALMLFTPLAPILFMLGVIVTPFSRLGLLLIVAAILIKIAGVIIHFITLPVELDASFNKALPILIEGEYIRQQDYRHARAILRAAAMTYVSATLSQLVMVWRWVILRR